MLHVCVLERLDSGIVTVWHIFNIQMNKPQCSSVFPGLFTLRLKLQMHPQEQVPLTTKYLSQPAPSFTLTGALSVVQKLNYSHPHLFGIELPLNVTY